MDGHAFVNSFIRSFIRAGGQAWGVTGGWLCRLERGVAAGRAGLFVSAQRVPSPLTPLFDLAKLINDEDALSLRHVGRFHDPHRARIALELGCGVIE